MALRISLEFSDDPDWFYTLTPDRQARVIAYDRIRRKAKKAPRGGGVARDREDALRELFGERVGSVATEGR